ncbi:MAG: iron-sulfur cluster assembly protein, partial [Marinicaulis sp.]|nr:iron-sulfur cluster assembly protein [Marinicaulis sp.]
MIDPLPIRVRNALTAVIGPDGVNIVASGIVQGLNIDDDSHVRFTLEMPPGVSNPDELMGQAKA